MKASFDWVELLTQKSTPKHLSPVELLWGFYGGHFHVHMFRVMSELLRALDSSSGIFDQQSVVLSPSPGNCVYKGKVHVR